jgi:hypothetical protein
MPEHIKILPTDFFSSAEFVAYCKKNESTAPKTYEDLDGCAPNIKECFYNCVLKTIATASDKTTFISTDGFDDKLVTDLVGHLHSRHHQASTSHRPQNFKAKHILYAGILLRYFGHLIHNPKVLSKLLSMSGEIISTKQLRESTTANKTKPAPALVAFANMQHLLKISEVLLRLNYDAAGLKALVSNCKENLAKLATKFGVHNSVEEPVQIDNSSVCAMVLKGQAVMAGEQADIISTTLALLSGPGFKEDKLALLSAIHSGHIGFSKEKMQNFNAALIASMQSRVYDAAILTRIYDLGLGLRNSDHLYRRIRAFLQRYSLNTSSYITDSSAAEHALKWFSKLQADDTKCRLMSIICAAKNSQRLNEASKRKLACAIFEDQHAAFSPETIRAIAKYILELAELARDFELQAEQKKQWQKAEATADALDAVMDEIRPFFEISGEVTKLQVQPMICP